MNDRCTTQPSPTNTLHQNTRDQTCATCEEAFRSPPTPLLCSPVCVLIHLTRTFRRRYSVNHHHQQQSRAWVVLPRGGEQALGGGGKGEFDHCTSITGRLLPPLPELPLHQSHPWILSAWPACTAHTAPLPTPATKRLASRRRQVTLITPCRVQAADYIGKWVLLFFYPKDFTFVCPTEIIAFSDAAESFRARNCEVVGASTDSAEVHLAWIRTPRRRGGLGHMQIPLLADVDRRVSRAYGVLGAGNFPYRGMFLIDPKASPPLPPGASTCVRHSDPTV